ARLAPAPPAQPARRVLPGRHLDPAPQLPGDGPGPAEPGDGAPPGRRTGDPTAGTQPLAGGGRLRSYLPGDSSGRPEMAAIRETLEQLLAGHEPFPAVIVDRGWNLVLANTSTAVLIEGLAGELVAPPLN